MIVNSRGSRPLSDETDRSARVMRALAIRWMPWAASITESPSGYAIRATAASARALRIVIWASATGAADPALAPATPPRRHEPEHAVGIGAGRLDAAPPVARRPRSSPGALRPAL